MSTSHDVIPLSFFCFFFFNDTATTEIYTLSLHDALPICAPAAPPWDRASGRSRRAVVSRLVGVDAMSPQGLESALDTGCLGLFDRRVSVGGHVGAGRLVVGRLVLVLVLVIGGLDAAGDGDDEFVQQVGQLGVRAGGRHDRGPGTSG